MALQPDTHVIGITIGDPAGIGPEITLKALRQPVGGGDFQAVAIGSLSILAATASELGLPVELVPWQPGAPLPSGSGTIGVYGVGSPWPRPPLGRASAVGGHYALAAIEAAVSLVSAGAIAAMTTAPVAKESFSLAGCNTLGHTDLLANLSGATDYAMMMSAKGLHVVHVTTHLPLAEACRAITEELVVRRIRLAARTARELDLPRNNVAVCGLNPHAGENGLLGREETSIIQPAMERARAEGIECSGPFSPDTVFARAMRGDFQMILAMYHDQGHIPIKILGFMDGVNTTLGLPFVRTSVDHGTAFARAGKGTADPGSLLAAIGMAAELCHLRSRSDPYGRQLDQGAPVRE